MIRHLYIKDYVIIDELNIDFKEGFSVFTGETGAGKSIIIDAISLLCGERLSSNVVRSGAKKAVIEAVITIDHPIVKQLLEEAGFELEEENILSREISADLKSTMRFNYRTITQSFARELTENLIDIHNQHGTQYLLNPKNHLTLLDEYLNDSKTKNDVAEAYRTYYEKKRKLEETLNTDFNLEDRDYLFYQKQEIENLHMQKGELEELEEKEKKLLSFEKTSEALSAATSELSGNNGALEHLYLGKKELENVADPEIQETISKINDYYFELEDLFERVNDYYHTLSYDENEFNAIQDRIFTIKKVVRKYGGSYKSMMERLAEIEEKLRLMEHREEYLKEAQADMEKAYQAYLSIARVLSSKRKDAALKLEKKIKKELGDLELSNTTFHVDIAERDGNKEGIDRVEFFISTNPGQPLNPLSQVASGGELSRIMLGLKTIFNSLFGIETIIFDEIDSGVSGKIATSIGLKMRKIAEKAQVLSITHLGQVAACAANHYFIYKEVKDDTTYSRIRELSYEERVEELANIATGTQSQAALQSARELLERLQK